MSANFWPAIAASFWNALPAAVVLTSIVMIWRYALALARDATTRRTVETLGWLATLSSLAAQPAFLIVVGFETITLYGVHPQYAAAREQWGYTVVAAAIHLGWAVLLAAAVPVEHSLRRFRVARRLDLASLTTFGGLVVLPGLAQAVALVAVLSSVIQGMVFLPTLYMGSDSGGTVGRLLRLGTAEFGVTKTTLAAVTSIYIAEIVLASLIFVIVRRGLGAARWTAFVISRGRPFVSLPRFRRGRRGWVLVAASTVVIVPILCGEAFLAIGSKGLDLLVGLAQGGPGEARRLVDALDDASARRPWSEAVLGSAGVASTAALVAMSAAVIAVQWVVRTQLSVTTRRTARVSLVLGAGALIPATLYGFGTRSILMRWPVPGLLGVTAVYATIVALFVMHRTVCERRWRLAFTEQLFTLTGLWCTKIGRPYVAALATVAAVAALTAFNDVSIALFGAGKFPVLASYWVVLGRERLSEDVAAAMSALQIALVALAAAPTWAYYREALHD